jgi:hypothetical protein
VNLPFSRHLLVITGEVYELALFRSGLAHQNGPADFMPERVPYFSQSETWGTHRRFVV